MLFVALSSANALMTVDFEPPGYVPGNSVQALKPDGTTQSPPVSGTNADAQAWSVRDSSTEKVVNFGGVHGKVWQLGGNTGNLQTRPHSPHAGNLPSSSSKQFSGESTAIDDFGNETPTTNTYYAEFDFRGVDNLSGFSSGTVDISSSCGDDCRQSYIRVMDDGNAFDLRFFDTGVNGFSDFVAHDFDTNLAYDNWHTLGMGIRFIDGQNVDGTGNDIVTYFLDGNPLFTGTSWETGYRISTSSVRGIDRLAFVSSVGDSKGLYFDNILISDQIPTSAPIPEPTTWLLFGTGLLGVFGFGRKKFMKKRPPVSEYKNF